MGSADAFFPELTAYLARRHGEVGDIVPSRRERLRELARYIHTARNEGRPAQIIFVCTHNSGRSQLSQVWGTTAAAWFGLSNEVSVYSGGTEATSVNPRILEALGRAGFRGDDAVRFGPEAAPIRLSSKRYDDPANPQQDFDVVMNCNEADRNCPLVLGARHRLSLPYADPRDADGEPDAREVYDARCAQIAAELLFAFSEATRRE